MDRIDEEVTGLPAARLRGHALQAYVWEKVLGSYGLVLLDKHFSDDSFYLEFMFEPPLPSWVPSGVTFPAWFRIGHDASGTIWQCSIFSQGKILEVPGDVLLLLMQRGSDLLTEEGEDFFR